MEIQASDMLSDTVGESSALLVTLLEHSSDAVMLVDFDGRVTHWNPACEHVFGYSSAQALGAVLPQIAPEMRTRAVTDLRAIIASGRVAHRERQARRSDGIPLLVECITIPALDRDGHASGAFVIVHDAVNSEYPQPVARLVDVVSTGLLAPLDALWTGLGLLARPEIAGDTVRRMETMAILRSTLSSARSAASDLARVIRLASGEPPVERNVVDIVTIATELAACESIGVAVSVEFAADLGFLSGEGSLLVRALELLARMVAGDCTDARQLVRISIDRTGNEVLIELKSGVPTTDAQRVEQLGGYFLRGGLPESLAAAELDAYLVRGVIEAHHGSVGIRTAATGRVRATVRLPAIGPTASEEETT